MIIDPAWFIERLHSDGHWECIDTRAKEIFDTRLAREDPSRRSKSADWLLENRQKFGEYDLVWPGILTGEPALHSQVNPLAKPGWPSDVSRIISDAFDESMYHHAGHYTLDALWDVADKDPAQCAPGSHPSRVAKARLGYLEIILAMTPSMMFGDMTGPNGKAYHDIETASQHRKMEVAGRAARLQPIGRDTVRVLIG